jgi:hypothetical protein
MTLLDVLTVNLVPREIMPFVMYQRKASRPVRKVSSPCYTARRKRPVPSSTPPPVMTTLYEEAGTGAP